MKARGSKNPLENNSKYEKVKDLNAGAFGFVQLAKEKETGERVAIKFMERGHKITKVLPTVFCYCHHPRLGPCAS